VTQKKERKKKTEEIELELTPQQTLLTKLNYNLKCKNDRQKQFIKLIEEKDIVICAGPAGTGKTYVACSEALHLLAKESHKYKKIIIVKSVTVLEGEEIGFLKGTLKEKMEPIINSFMDNFHKIIGKFLTEQLVEHGIIEVLPLAYIQGRSIDNAIIIVDESQNISVLNMKMTMTRLGENSKMIIIGDTKQVAKLKNGNSALAKIVKYFENVNEIGIMEFYREDIVRNPLIIKIEEIFENHINV
jgi:phosphate starvation-inducible PhoH-like protein